MTLLREPEQVVMAIHWWLSYD